MKHLDPAEQLQIQLDIENAKATIDDLKKQIEGLGQWIANMEKLIVSSNETLKSHHQLIVELSKRVLKSEEI